MPPKKTVESAGLVGKKIGEETNPTTDAGKPPARVGRPKQNPHAEDKQLTIRVPAELHRRLKYASVDLDKPMVEIAVDALIAFLAKHEG